MELNYQSLPVYSCRTHVERDEEYVQGGGLFGGRDGLALELQFAKLRPANPVQVGTGVHVLQEHQQSVTVLVFDWLKIHLTNVLGSQHSLRKDIRY